MNDHRVLRIGGIGLIASALFVLMVMFMPTPTAQAQYSTLVTLSSSLNPSNVGQPVTFTSLVTVTFQLNNPQRPRQTGTVTFFDGAATLGSVPLDHATVPTSATFTTSSLTAGSHNITAQFVGDGDFQGAAGTSNTVVQLVRAPVAPTAVPTAPKEVPEAETLLLLGGGIGGLGTWLRWQWMKRKK